MTMHGFMRMVPYVGGARREYFFMDRVSVVVVSWFAHPTVMMMCVNIFSDSNPFIVTI